MHHLQTVLESGQQGGDDGDFELWDQVSIIFIN